MVRKYDPAIPFLDLRSNTFTRIFIANYSRYPISENNPDIYQLMNEQTKCGVPKQWNSIQSREIINATAWINLESIMLLSERSQIQRSPIV